MEHQVPLPDAQQAFDPKADNARNDKTHEIADDLAYRRLGLVNVVFYGLPNAGDRNWVLIDAGVPGTRGLIESAAALRFGEGARPAAIVMTHGHFDHVGALVDLAEHWDAPVYAHQDELPYLSGKSSYLPPDPTVGGGIMALMSPLFPRGPVDVGERLHVLPADGIVPFMPGWRWIHTPGHSPGHTSFWRASDRALIAGDAFVTTKQESVYAVATQEPELHGPPMYFTPDWNSAKLSVRDLAALDPETVVTGHGQALRGPEMRAALNELARNFDEIAVPKHGLYVHHPEEIGNATTENS